MSRKCPNCAADVLDNAKFCIKCGTKMPPVTTPIVSSPTPDVRVTAPPVPSAMHAPTPSASSSVNLAEMSAVNAPISSGSVDSVHKEEVNQAQGDFSKPPKSNASTINEPAKGGGNKNLIFGAIGVLVVVVGGFLLTSGKDEPSSAGKNPAVSTPPLQTAPPAPPPVATTPAPIPAAQSVTPPKPAPAVSPKPAPVTAPESQSAPGVPDVNKLMRDAANK